MRVAGYNPAGVTTSHGGVAGRPADNYRQGGSLSLFSALRTLGDHGRDLPQMEQLQRVGKDNSKRGMQAIFDQGSPPPCPAPFNLAAYVLHRAQQLANKTALAVIRQDGAECWSYAALEAAVLGAASGFLS